MGVWAKRLALAFGGVAGLVVLAVGAVFGSSQRMLSATWDVPQARIEHPWPFDDDDLVALRAEALASLPDGAEVPADPLALLDLSGLRTERARARGAALATRLGCTDCHAGDLGGRVVMDVGPVMTLSAPNVTRGALGDDYPIADFERIVRHGVRRDGTTSFMPAIDYANLSDREISDLYEYVRSVPSVERASPPSRWGPVMRALYATGQVPPLSPHRIDHAARRPKVPPARTDRLAYGAHLAQTCVGCHRADFRGGPVRDGDPSWPPAANLTPHASGSKGWTADDFKTLMRTGIRPDGRAVDPAGMPWATLGQLDDDELEAMHAYFQSLAPLETGR